MSFAAYEFLTSAKLTGSFATEVAARAAADAAEATARAAGDAAEATARAAGDAAEATARAAADADEVTARNAAILVETNRAIAAEALLAPKASPALTGIPTAPTQAPGTNNTQIATTAFSAAAVAAEATARTNGALGGPAQSWQAVIGSRAPYTVYTNSTGRPIYINVAASSAANNDQLYIPINGVNVSTVGANVAGTNMAIAAIVPNGGTYYLATVLAAAITLSQWQELR